MPLLHKHTTTFFSQKKKEKKKKNKKKKNTPTEMKAQKLLLRIILKLSLRGSSSVVKKGKLTLVTT